MKETLHFLTSQHAKTFIANEVTALQAKGTEH